jgi:lipid-binding SYLF domain-containing protein
MRRRHLALASLGLAPLALAPVAARAATRAEIDHDVAGAVTRLRAAPNTTVLFENAKAILVFPRILSGGFLVGGQYGHGALLRGGATEGYFRIFGASFGLTIGAQSSGLAMFFMTDEALAALQRADGWEIGGAAGVVALDAGLAANITASTLTQPVYAVTFGQQGLMASMALAGTKISRYQAE